MVGDACLASAKHHGTPPDRFDAKPYTVEHHRAPAVFDRIKECLGMASDAELAWWFGTTPQSISNRKRRNSVPYAEAIYIAAWANESLDYLLTGEHHHAEPPAEES